MPENKSDNEMLEQAAEAYSHILEDAANEIYREADALEVEIPDRLTKRLPRKYKLGLNRPERHERRVQSVALAFAIILLRAIWLPQTVTAVGN